MHNRHTFLFSASLILLFAIFLGACKRISSSATPTSLITPSSTPILEATSITSTPTSPTLHPTRRALPLRQAKPIPTYHFFVTYSNWATIPTTSSTNWTTYIIPGAPAIRNTKQDARSDNYSDPGHNIIHANCDGIYHPTSSWSSSQPIRHTTLSRSSNYGYTAAIPRSSDFNTQTHSNSIQVSHSSQHTNGSYNSTSSTNISHRYPTGDCD